MFDIGFWELCLVGLVSLLVLGPERLPKAARIAGFWLGKARNMVASVKAEIHEELQAEEMRQMLRDQTTLEELDQVREDGREALKEARESLESISQQHARND